MSRKHDATLALFDNNKLLGIKLIFGDTGSIDLLTDFLKSVLQLPTDDYGEVTIIDPHLKREHAGDKLGILDVRVRTKTKNIIIVIRYMTLKQKVNLRIL